MNLSEQPFCTHVGLADECNYNDKHSYPAIALVSLPADHYESMTFELTEILQESDVQEFKRNKLKNAKYRFVALKFVDFAVGNVMREALRIDVLIWDWSDSRHDVRGIDRIANFQRLYYQLLKHVFGSRWEKGATWLFFPDQQGSLDWFEVESFLENAGEYLDLDPGLLEQGPFQVRLRTDFRISGISECDSKDEPLIQLADLFAGLASYSRSNYSKIVYLRDSGEGSPQLHLPGFGPEPVKLSGKDEEHCRVILELDRLCKKNRLGVSLRTNKGLRTLDPNNPLNFWWYKPQHEHDKAPTKN